MFVESIDFMKKRLNKEMIFKNFDRNEVSRESLNFSEK
jgi:hypothetical protein